MHINDLSAAEIALIQRHRSEQGNPAAEQAFQRKAIATAHAFFVWGQETGEPLTFPAFTYAFGYADEDSVALYAAIQRIIEAARAHQTGKPRPAKAHKSQRIDERQIERLRHLTAENTLQRLGLYAKIDRDYQPSKNKQSKRLHVALDNAVFELVVTGEKWYDTRAQKGGGGAIDLTMHLYRETFTRAVNRLQSTTPPETTD